MSEVKSVQEAQERVDTLWQAIQENEEENRFMQQEIDELSEQFPEIT